MDAYVVSHNGLGDNLFMIGALHYLSQYYENVYFLCKQKHYDNVSLLFLNTPTIHCVPFKHSNLFEFYEYEDIHNIISEKYNDEKNDIFVCGLHKRYLTTKITNQKLLDEEIVDTNYTIDWDTLTSENYSFIEEFYKDINLNLTHFFDYFNIDSTRKSRKMYESVSDYYIVFIQSNTSNETALNMTNLIEKYIDDDTVLLVCNDNNLYKDKKSKKYELARQFVYNKLVYYIDVIKNSDEIYLIDSCFIGIVLPLLKTNKLKADKVRIILRENAKDIEI
jgi:hypothetical protein